MAKKVREALVRGGFTEFIAGDKPGFCIIEDEWVLGMINRRFGKPVNEGVVIALLRGRTYQDVKSVAGRYLTTLQEQHFAAETLDTPDLIVYVYVSTSPE